MHFDQVTANGVNSNIKRGRDSREFRPFLRVNEGYDILKII